MADRRSNKRRKRQADLSLDDENDGAYLKAKRPAHITTAVARNIQLEPVPTRARQGRTSHVRKPEDIPDLNALTQYVEANPSSKKSKSASIYDFFSSSALTQVRQRPHHHILDTKISENIDLIEDGEDSRNGASDRHDPKQDDQSPPREALSRPNRSKNNSAFAFKGMNCYVSRRFVPERRETSETLLGVHEAKKLRDTRPWFEKYGPSGLGELTVHKKKVEVVRIWLSNVLRGRERKRLLVLRGPSGSAKTSTIDVLSKAMGFDIIEWRNPVGQGYGTESYVSLSTQFREFLERSGRFGGLTFHGYETADRVGSSQSPKDLDIRDKVILVEELPHTMIQSTAGLDSFRMNLLSYLASNVPPPGLQHGNSNRYSRPIPIVMVITEITKGSSITVSESFTAFRLLGSDIMHHPGTTVLDFNRIAPTLVSKALEAVLRKEACDTGRQKAPSTALISQLSQLGDVRNAVSSLEFLCLRGNLNNDRINRLTHNKSQKISLTATERDVLENVVQRTDTLDLFHAVGKVVHNKRRHHFEFDPPLDRPTEPPSYLGHYARVKNSEVDIEQLINEIGTDLETFVAALHENYVLSCEDDDFVDILNSSCDVLSDADLICTSPELSSFVPMPHVRRGSNNINDLRQNEIGFQLSVRGLLFFLPSPVKRITTKRSTVSSGRDPYKMFYPASMRLWKQVEEIESVANQCLTRSNGPLFEAGTMKTSSSVKQYQLEGCTRGAYTHTTSLDVSISCAFRSKISSSDILLDILPYFLKIEQEQSPDSTLVRQLAKIVTFVGYNDVMDATNGEEISSINSKPSGTTPARFEQPTGHSNLDSTTLPWSYKDTKLLLSDDDIEI